QRRTALPIGTPPHARIWGRSHLCSRVGSRTSIGRRSGHDLLLRNGWAPGARGPDWHPPDDRDAAPHPLPAADEDRRARRETEVRPGSEADHSEALPRTQTVARPHAADDAPRDRAGDLPHPDASLLSGEQDLVS